MITANLMLLLIASIGGLLVVGAARHLARRQQRSTVLDKLASKDPLADQVHFEPEPVRIGLKPPRMDGS